MDLYKLGVKIFASNPDVAAIHDFIPVFHSWIQKQDIEGHQLIDVHDYSHVHQGPGILLVAHEGNFSMDQEGGRLGLVYYRKHPTPDALKAVLNTAEAACRLLEAEPKLNGLKFHTDEFLVFSNDRLLAPNTADARTQLEATIKNAFGNVTVTIAGESKDARERLAFVVKRG